MKVILQVTEFVMEMNSRKRNSTEHGYYSHTHARITMKHATRNLS
jgi:hypothetical protein